MQSLFPVVHQAKNADGAGGDIQIVQHRIGIGKGETADANQLGEDLRLEGLIPGQQQKVKFRLLPVAEE